MLIRKTRKEVRFANGHVADFEFSLVRNEREWDYGNGTRVELLDRNSGYASRQTLDTRYDTDIMVDGSNFDRWVDEYLRYRFEGLTA